MAYLLCSNEKALKYVGRLTSKWECAMPGVFYAAMFILTTR
ncbi:hypothetical protein [Nitrospira sp. KM1]|nr:hypothetical protein [Nitrospira sp. KM1]